MNRSGCEAGWLFPKKQTVGLSWGVARQGNRPRKIASSSLSDPNLLDALKIGISDLDLKMLDLGVVFGQLLAQSPDCKIIAPDAQNVIFDVPTFLHTHRSLRTSIWNFHRIFRLSENSKNF
eukprot:gene17888-biopygen5168